MDKKIIFMVMLALLTIGFGVSVAPQLVESFDLETKNDFRVEWYDLSSLSKGEYVVAVQNLNSYERSFTMNILMRNSNVDLSKVKNLQVYEWKAVEEVTKVPIWETENVNECREEFLLNESKCTQYTRDYIRGYTDRVEVKNVWLKIGNTNYRLENNNILEYETLSRTIPEYNSRLEAESYNGTRYFKVTYTKPIEEIGQYFGSRIEVYAENEGYTYHPVDTAQCSYYTPITIVNNNNSQVISRSFNVSLDMSGANWNGNEYVMVANNSLEVDFNISNPNTANAMVYFGMVNISAGGQTTLRLYHYGGSCVGTETTVRGYDANYVSYNNTLKGAYLTFNEPESKANQVNNLHTRNLAVSKSSNGMYNSQSYKNIDKGFCLDNANVSGGIDATGFSIEFWFSPVTNWNPASSRKDMVGIAAAGNNDVLIDYNRLSTKLSVYYAPAGVSLGYVANFSAGQWYHVLYTNDGATGKLYVNGLLRDSAAQAGAVTNKDTIFFMDKNDVCTIAGASQNPADMYIDEFSYYHDIIYPENTLRPPTLETITAGTDQTTLNPTGVPSPFSPTNNSNIVDTTPTLEWYNSTSSVQPVSYYLEVYNDSALSQLNTNVSNLTQAAGLSTSYTLSEQPSGTYYWRVRGWNTQAFSNWNGTWIFTISTDPSVTTPQLSYTAPLYNLTDINVSLTASDPLSGTMGVDFILYINEEIRGNMSVLNVPSGGNISIIIKHENYSHFDNVKVGAYAYTTTTGTKVNSSSVSVLNAPPTTPTTFLPESGGVTENITFLITCSGSTDIDNDTLYYEFYVDKNNPSTTIRQNSTTITYDSADIQAGVNYYRCRTNDQVGNLSSFTENRNISFVSGQINSWNFSWDLEQYETLLSSFMTTITYNNLRIGTINATITYNSTNYSSYITLNENGTKTFIANITLPIVDNTMNKTFRWSFYETWYNGTFTSNATDQYHQKVLNVENYACSIANASSDLILFMPIVSEPNRTKQFADVQAEFTTWIQNKSYSFTTSINMNNITNFSICGYPKGFNWTSDADIYYVGSEGDSFSSRQHYLRSVGLNASIYNVSLYLIPSNDDLFLPFQIVDSNGAGLENHYVEIWRKDFTTLEYDLVAIGKTDSDGYTKIYLEPYDAFYQARVFNYNKLLKSTSDFTIDTASTKVINVFEDELSQVLENFRGVQYSFTFNNNTKQFLLTYSDGTAEMDRGCMKVNRLSASASSPSVVYDGCVESNVGSLSFTIPDNSSTYSAVFYGEFKGIEKVIKEIEFDFRQTIAQLMGMDGLFAAFIIVLTLALVGIWSPAASLSFAALGLVITYALGLTLMSIGALMSILIVFLIAIYKVRT